MSTAITHPPFVHPDYKGPAIVPMHIIGDEVQYRSDGRNIDARVVGVYVSPNGTIFYTVVTKVSPNSTPGNYSGEAVLFKDEQALLRKDLAHTRDQLTAAVADLNAARAELNAARAEMSKGL